MAVFVRCPLCRGEIKELQDTSVESLECPVCLDEYTDACIFGCGHSTCEKCYEEMYNKVARENGSIMSENEENRLVQLVVNRAEEPLPGDIISLIHYRVRWNFIRVSPPDNFFEHFQGFRTRHSNGKDKSYVDKYIFTYAARDCVWIKNVGNYINEWTLFGVDSRRPISVSNHPMAYRWDPPLPPTWGICSGFFGEPEYVKRSKRWRYIKPQWFG